MLVCPGSAIAACERGLTRAHVEYRPPLLNLEVLIPARTAAVHQRFPSNPDRLGNEPHRTRATLPPARRFHPDKTSSVRGPCTVIHLVSLHSGLSRTVG